MQKSCANYNRSKVQSSKHKGETEVISGTSLFFKFRLLLELGLFFGGAFLVMGLAAHDAALILVLFLDVVSSGFLIL